MLVPTVFFGNLDVVKKDKLSMVMEIAIKTIPADATIQEITIFLSNLEIHAFVSHQKKIAPVI